MNGLAMILRWVGSAIALLWGLSGCGLVLDTSPPERECSRDSQCDDGDACNGVETCPDGTCVAGTAPCDDGIACTVDSDCDPSDGCDSVPNDDACVGDNQVCILGMGCQQRVPCDGPEDCGDLDVGTCVKGVCGSDGFCTNEQMDNLCPDDTHVCTIESCDSVGVCHSDPSNEFCTNMDPFACVIDTCEPGNPEADENDCVHTPNDDVCDDGQDCTVQDVCDPENDFAVDGCVHRPDDSFCEDRNGSCTVGACVPYLGCQVRVNAAVCESLGTHCDVETGQCAPIEGTCAGGCDDGNPCNGNETCPVTSCQVTTVDLGCLPTAMACKQTVCVEEDGDFSCELRTDPDCVVVGADAGVN
jgi:hypothetical protein